jgi:hypothetical protein
MDGQTIIEILLMKLLLVFVFLTYMILIFPGVKDTEFIRKVMLTTIKFSFGRIKTA